MRKHLLALALLAGCFRVPPAGAICVNPSTTCGNSRTTYLDMCRLPVGCKNPDYASNLENSLITIDQKFAPTVVLQGHGHRGTNGDGPKLDLSSALDCTNSPTNGQVPTWNSASSKCTWATGGGGGSGTITGPGSSLDLSIPTWDGITGTILKDNNQWFITSDLLATSRTGTATGHTDFGITDATTNSTNFQTKFLSVLSDGGAGWTGTSSSVVGVYYDITGAPTGSNLAIYDANGNVVIASGSLGIGLGDTTPDYRLEVDQTNAAQDPFGIVVSGTRATSGVGAAIINSTTGGNGSNIKYGLAINNSGSYSGNNAGVLCAGMNGASVDNLCVAALQGDVKVFEGQVNTKTTTSKTASETLCTGNPTRCARVTSTGISGAANFGLQVNATSKDSGEVNAMEINSTNSNGGISNALNIFSTTTSSASSSGIFARVVSGGSAIGMDFGLTGGGGTSQSTGVRVAVDGGGSSLPSTGFEITSSNSTGAIALETKGGSVFFSPTGSSGDTTFAWDAASGHTALNVGTSVSANDAFTVNSDDDKTAIVAVCNGTTGQTCMTTTINGGAAGTNIGHQVAVTSSGTADSIALYATAGGGSGSNFALAAPFGDVEFGTTGVSEGFHYDDTHKQLTLNDGGGAGATNVDGNTLEVHNNGGSKVDIQVIGTSEGTVAISSSLDNTAVATASTAHSFTNSQTSSTASINKTAMLVTSTGTWNGASAINSAIAATATGGTTNYAILAQQGLIGGNAGTASLVYFRAGGVLHVDTTTVGNVNTGEDDLSTYSIPGSTLSTNGDSVEFSAAGTFANTVNAKRLRVRFGSTVIFDTGAAGIPISAAIQWALQGECIRTGATAQKCSASMATSNATLAAYASYATAAETLSGAVILKLTGDATTTNDVVQETFKVKWMPANT